MAEVLNAGVDNLERNDDIDIDLMENSSKPSSATSSCLPTPPQLLPARRGRESDRDSRERRDESNRSPPPPPPPPSRQRKYNCGRQYSVSPPSPLYRDHRGGGHSPPFRRSPQYPPYKQPRKEDYDGRRRGWIWTW